MRVPIVFSRQGFVDAVVEVFVVRKDDMTANIIQLCDKSAGSQVQNSAAAALTKPSFVTSVDARPPGVSLESMINHDGPL